MLAAKLGVAGGKRRFADGYSIMFDWPGGKLAWQEVVDMSVDVLELPPLSVKFGELLPADILMAQTRARALANVAANV